MKKKKIAGISFLVRETATGLRFEMDKKADVLKALEMGANSVSSEIGKVLNKAFGKGAFYYKSGAPIEQGLEFRKAPVRLLDKL